MGPTHYVTNKFTYAYQEFVNTYGIPRYQEANPALFTTATFPFLFGVMYGDIGHGLLLMCVGLFFIWNEGYLANQLLGEVSNYDGEWVGCNDQGYGSTPGGYAYTGYDTMA